MNDRKHLDLDALKRRFQGLITPADIGRLGNTWARDYSVDVPVLIAEVEYLRSIIRFVHEDHPIALAQAIRKMTQATGEAGP